MRRMHREQAGHAFDHDLARVALGFTNKCYTCLWIADGHGTNPFRTGARLACAATAENEPRRPRLAIVCEIGRKLVAMRENRKVTQEELALARLYFSQQLRRQFRHLRFAER